MAITTMPSPALSDAERHLLQHLADAADLLLVDGEAFLLLPVSPADLDALAEVGAVTDELEEGADLEPEEDDCSRHAEDDDEPPPVYVPGDDQDFEPEPDRQVDRAAWLYSHGRIYRHTDPFGQRGYFLSSLRPLGEADPAEGNRAPGWRGGPVLSARRAAP